MATKYWTDGGGDGNIMTAANWNDTAAPANTDVLIIGTSNRVIETGVGASALTGITLKVTPGFGGTIGVAAPLIFASITLCEYAGTGAYCNVGCGGTVTTGTLFHTVGQFIASSGTWTTLTNSTGILTIAAATVVTTLQNVAGVVTAGYNATAFTTASSGGTLNTSRVCTTLNVLRGATIQFNNGTTNFNTCGTVNIHNGGTYNKQSGGTDTTVNAFPGSRFTVVGNAGGSGTTVTITTLNEWAGSIVIDTVPGLTVTIGTRNKIGAPAGGTVFPAP